MLLMCLMLFNSINNSLKKNQIIGSVIVRKSDHQRRQLLIGRSALCYKSFASSHILDIWRAVLQSSATGRLRNRAYKCRSTKVRVKSRSVGGGILESWQQVDREGSDRDNEAWLAAQVRLSRKGTGRPRESTATQTTSASVTFTKCFPCGP
jgi:hypothetical protein